MSLYISICENYSVSKLNGIDSVVRRCKPYTLQDGSSVTEQLARQELKNGSFNIYDYDADELNEAKQSGSVRGVDWIMKIQKL